MSLEHDQMCNICINHLFTLITFDKSKDKFEEKKKPF